VKVIAVYECFMLSHNLEETKESFGLIIEANRILEIQIDSEFLRILEIFYQTKHLFS
jgi:hypothetical protein